MVTSSSSAPSTGYCSTMGTATTMNSLAEALGMMLPGCAAIPAVHKERGQIAYYTGRRAVEMVRVLSDAGFLRGSLLTSFREIISVVGCIRVRMQRRRVFGSDRNSGVVQVKYTNQSPFFRKGRE